MTLRCWSWAKIILSTQFYKFLKQNLPDLISEQPHRNLIGISHKNIRIIAKPEKDIFSRPAADVQNLLLA